MRCKCHVMKSIIKLEEYKDRHIDIRDSLTVWAMSTRGGKTNIIWENVTEYNTTSLG